MARIKLMVAVFLMLGCLVSCDDDDDNRVTSPTTVTGSGTFVTEARTMSPFSAVSLNTVGDVVITQGAVQACTLTVDDNILPYIETVVSGGKLNINARSNVSIQDFDLTVKLVMTDIYDLGIEGVGSITGSNQVQSDRLRLAVEGVGSIYMDIDVDSVETSGTGVGSILLQGTAIKHRSYMMAVVNMNAFDLITDTTTINITGEGNAEVHATDYLGVTITGVGSVYYRGNPRIDATITGVGQLVDAN